MVHNSKIQLVFFILKILILIIGIIWMFYWMVLSIGNYINPDPRNLLDMNKYVLYFCIIEGFIGITLCIILYRILSKRNTIIHKYKNNKESRA